MKGFGIEIKNTLLDPKHVKNMGESVWLYMWLVDHITSVNEEKVGTVLGGRPVRFEEIRQDLNVHRNTYTKWIKRLASYPYIQFQRTHYGYRFWVFKAHKRFGQKFTRLRQKFTQSVQGFT